MFSYDEKNVGPGSEDAKPGPSKKDNGKSQGNGDKKKKPAETKTTAPKDKQKSEEKRSNKQKKAFITLSYIVVAYMICWVPFHFCRTRIRSSWSRWRSWDTTCSASSSSSATQSSTTRYAVS